MILNTKVEKFFLSPLKNQSLAKTFWLWLLVPWTLFPIFFLAIIFLLAEFNLNNQISFSTILISLYSFCFYLFYMITNCLIKSFYIEGKTKKNILVSIFSLLLFLSILTIATIIYSSINLASKYLT